MTPDSRKEFLLEFRKLEGPGVSGKGTDCGSFPLKSFLEGCGGHRVGGKLGGQGFWEGAAQGSAMRL